MLMLGRETHAPIDLMFGGPPQDEVHPPNECEYVIALKERMTKVHHDSP